VIVGRLELTVGIPAARSLKDKRRVIKSLLKRIHNQHNAAAAEVADNDKWQIAQVGVAVVSNRGDHANSQLSAIVNMVQGEREVALIDYTIEIA
jgi:uncharacterized protein YlxP (DUF503 family)